MLESEARYSHLVFIIFAGGCCRGRRLQCQKRLLITNQHPLLIFKISTTREYLSLIVDRL